MLCIIFIWGCHKWEHFWVNCWNQSRYTKTKFSAQCFLVRIVKILHLMCTVSQSASYTANPHLITLLKAATSQLNLESINSCPLGRRKLTESFVHFNIVCYQRNRCTILIRTYVFTWRIINIWNNLPSSSFNAFLQMKGWRCVGFLSNDLDLQSILLPQ